LSLAGGLPEASTFPRELLAEAAQRQLRTGDVLQYSTTEGEERLRRHVARYESVRQQREVDALDVVITTGSQQALAMLASIVADVGHAIAVPHPCYLGALQTFGAAGLRCHPVDVIDGELDLDRLDVQLQSGLQIQAMYVVANHGNPDGSRLDEAKNRRLAALADRWGFWLIEDDPYRELWFDTPPAPSLAAYTANAVSLGSFSKSIAPGLRVGWLVASGDLFAAVVRTKQSLDLHTSTLSQVLVAELLDEPDWFADHTDMLRSLYASRRSALVDALTSTFGKRISFTVPTGGMFAWAALDGVDTTDLLTEALAENVCFVPGVEFDAGGAPLRSWLRLSYATIDEARLGDAVHRLAIAVHRLDARDARDGRDGRDGCGRLLADEEARRQNLGLADICNS
jgi:2-aminoadipate transaminase